MMAPKIARRGGRKAASVAWVSSVLGDCPSSGSCGRGRETSILMTETT